MIAMDRRQRVILHAAAEGVYRRYEEAGAPHGRTWTGLERWLCELPDGALGPPIALWRAVKAKMPTEQILRGYPYATQREYEERLR